MVPVLSVRCEVCCVMCDVMYDSVAHSKRERRDV